MRYSWTADGVEFTFEAIGEFDIEDEILDCWNKVSDEEVKMPTIRFWILNPEDFDKLYRDIIKSEEHKDKSDFDGTEEYGYKVKDSERCGFWHYLSLEPRVVGLFLKKQPLEKLNKLPEVEYLRFVVLHEIEHLKAYESKIQKLGY